MVDIRNNPFAALTEYESRHLAAHLAVSGRDEDLHRLLALETSDGCNAWYEAKEAVGNIQGYQADLNQAWQVAETKGDIPRQIKYALCQSSMVSIATNYLPGLLVLALQYQCLTPRQVLTIVSQVYYEMRAEALLDIIEISG
jgi:hypothetical protein